MAWLLSTPLGVLATLVLAGAIVKLIRALLRRRLAQPDERGAVEGGALAGSGPEREDDEARSTDRERWRCVLCGQDDPGTQQASAASSPCSYAPDDGFRPCVLCGSAREPQRAAARAHEVRALWRPQESHVQCAVEEASWDRARTRGRHLPPSLLAAADQAGRGRDAHRRRATEDDPRRAALLEAAEGTRAVMEAMAARRKANAASAQPPET